MDIQVNELTVEQIKQYNPNLFKAIQESIDPNKEIETLKASLEAEKVTNKGLSDENGTLKAKVKELEKNNTDLKTENDKFTAEKALAEKKGMIHTILDEAKLPKELVTDFFRESLLALDEEGIKKSVEERKQIAEKTKGVVTESGEEFQEEKDINEADKVAVKAAIRSGQ